MSTPDPLGEAPDFANNAAVSSKQLAIAGIKVTVFGLGELRADCKNVACLWLLHPRLFSQSAMTPMAHAAIGHWNDRLSRKTIKASTPGLIAVSFDQRNHGTREVDPVANKAWRDGNPRHAQDMFSIYQGTAQDTSQLITYLGAYLFPDGQRTLVEHMTLGVSLGGHASWHCVMHDSRVSTGVVVVGCPDYLTLMKDRARLSKLRSWTEASPPGSNFVGSSDFPHDLVSAVETYDPAGLLLGSVADRTGDIYRQEPSSEDKKRLIPLMTKMLRGKRILNLAGAADKLVPYAQGEQLLDWLKRAIAANGWFSDNDVVLKDLVFDGVGHAMTPAMVKEAVAFIAESLEQVESRRVESAPKM